jgi:hypothetical protein
VATARTSLGLGTAATAALGSANGAASLDSGGQVPLSQLGNAPVGSWLYAYKPADTTRANTNTAADDPDLAVTLTAGTWMVDVDLAALGDPANNLLVGWVFSGTSTTRMQMFMAPATTSADASAATPLNMKANVASAQWAVGISSVVNASVRARVTLQVTVTGVFKVQWSQVNVGSTATVIRAGSQIVATKLV